MYQMSHVQALWFHLLEDLCLGSGPKRVAAAKQHFLRFHSGQLLAWDLL